jgi:hypothetical protein
MHGSKADIPVLFSSPEGTIRAAGWGGMMVYIASFEQEVDHAPVFKGLPDDRCHEAHWGYVLQGHGQGVEPRIPGTIQRVGRPHLLRS